MNNKKLYISRNRRLLGGFTLIELLTVIAIIGILAGIIIPTVGAVRTSANKAKTKVQFSQWAAGIGMFKQEYGFYPILTGTAAPTVDTGTNLGTSAVGRQRFAEILTGRKVDGTALTSNGAGDPLNQNKRRNSFFSFSDSELTVSGTTVSSINDAFNNAEIYVIIDYDYDGIITTGTGSVKAGNGTDGYEATSYTPALTTGGVRAGVVFYSAGKGKSSTDIVTSW